ncbi:MAG: oligoendopeptidase F [Ruminococcus sp.]|uniref:oligoendopeptidase F n=1 Tax=Ruminococcus sp. TaxID=41978 RepID=UPI0025CCF180|nr:oligoendopeptidase F [Ruminococcus sp.]MBO4866419.1 oligoendopeptidase F [Ruminococcus sp.]
MSEERIPKRSEVAKENTWALEDIFPTDEDWEKALADFKKLPETIASYKGRLGESADTLLEYLKLCDEISVSADALANYAHRKSDEDTAVAKYQGYTGQLMNVYVAIGAAGSFETPELIAIPDDVLEGFYKANSGLELYRRHLDRIRRKKDHVLSEAEERLIAMTGEMGNAADKIYSMFSDADLKFEDAVDSNGKTHQVTHGSYIPLVKDADRELRKSAFTSIYKGYGSFRNTCAATLDSQMKALEFYSKARKYSSALESSLSANEVPVEVYHNLIKAVHDNMNYMYDYVALRKKLLGVDELHFYDLYTPIVSDFTMKVTFEEAKETVLKALAPMGEEYISILKEGFENRWIDVYENENKASGAYSAGARVHPFVMLNHKDTLDCMFTLAHEMGHALHSYFSNKNQPVVYSDYVIFVAEVASTCNEALLMQYLLAHTEDKKEKAYLINYFLEQFRTTLYRQTMFAEFELKCSEICASGDTLTADTLCQIYGDLNKLYFGDGIVLDEDIKMEWARIPHFYYDFYVYQYATGYSAAIALSQRILKEGAPAVKDYIEGFLCGGCSADPITLLKNAGVDMSTTKPVTDALKLFGDLIKQMDEFSN